jgi:hypothetical protein
MRNAAAIIGQVHRCARVAESRRGFATKGQLIFFA